MTRKAILGTSALLFAVVASFAFKANSNGRFGSGTLFTLSGSGTPTCKAVNCKKVAPSSTTFCALQTYYTKSDCSDIGQRIQPKQVAL